MAVSEIFNRLANIDAVSLMFSLALISVFKLSTPFCRHALVEINNVSIANVPLDVIVPPVIPVPLFVATLVTVPNDGFVFDITPVVGS